MPDTPRLPPTGDVRDVVDLGITLQRIASEHNIHNVFDDGGYKELLILRLFRMRKLYREGDDAEDEDGRRYEIKGVARVSSKGIVKSSLSVTTEHTLTQANIDRYRAVFLWIIAVWNQSEPEAIFEIPPQALEPYFAMWEAKLAAMQAAAAPGSAPVHLNNPKIPLAHVRRHGIQVWPPRDVPLRPEVQQALLAADAIDELSSDRARRTRRAPNAPPLRLRGDANPATVAPSTGATTSPDTPGNPPRPQRGM